MTKFKKTNDSSSFTEQRFYLAISCWAKADKETRPKYIKLDKGGREGGSKGCLHNQPKYVQYLQRGQGVEDAGRQLCQVIIEISESNKR